MRQIIGIAAFAGLWCTWAHAGPIPDRVWGTYLGGGMDDGEVHVALDAAGNIYAAGNTTAVTGFATKGAHKETPEAYDAYIIKFDPAGVRLWGTYFGGPSLDAVAGLAVRGDTVALCGLTESVSGIASPGAFQAAKSSDEGTFTGYAASFSGAGTWLWGTYVQTGSTDSDRAEGVAIGPQGEVYVTGVVRGSANLATPGAHQLVPSSLNDGYVIRLGAKGDLVWGTYHGGKGGDEGHAVVLDALGGVYIVGSTTSLDAIASPGAHQTNSGGDWDLFVARFKQGGALDWGTYYGGALEELGFDIAAHPGGGVVVSGRARSTGLGTPGTHQPVFAGGSGDAMLVRFDAAGTRLWSTYYGGTGVDGGYAVATDPLGGIYLAGETRGSKLNIASPNAYQQDLIGQGDAFAAKFNPMGAREWGTYFGGDGGQQEWEYIASIAARDSERVVVGGLTTASNNIATPDAHQVSLIGAREGDVAVFSTVPAKLCAGPGDCSGGPCVDGVCCDVDCGNGADDCQACSKAEGALVDGHCSPLAKDTLCRPSAGPCDAAESCTGKSGQCPVDADAPDGAACVDGLCMGGMCIPDGGTSSGGTSSDGLTEGTASTGSGASTTGTSAATSTTGVEPTSTSAATSDTGAQSTAEPTGTDTPSPPTDATDATDPTTTTTTTSATSSTTGPAMGDDGCACNTGSAPASGLCFGLLGALTAWRRRPRPHPGLK